MTIDFEPAAPDLCPVCGSSGMAPCYAPDGSEVPDHPGRPTAYAADPGLSDGLAYDQVMGKPQTDR